MFLQDVLGFRKSTKKQRYTSMASSLLKILDQGDLTCEWRNGYICVPFRQYVSFCVSAASVLVRMCHHTGQTCKASSHRASSCEFAMPQRKWWKCNCTVCSCVAFLRHASQSCALLDYLIVIMLRYACIADNGVTFLQCVWNCVFFQNSTLIGWVVAMCALLWFCSKPL